MPIQLVLQGMPYTAREFKLTCVRECAVEFGVLDCPEKAYQFWQAHVPSAPWFMEEREIMIAITLNTRKKVTGFTCWGSARWTRCSAIRVTCSGWRWCKMPLPW